jgi:hypothetical protein
MLPAAHSPGTAGLQAPLPILRAEGSEMLRAAGRAVVVATEGGAAIGLAVRDDPGSLASGHRQSRGGRVRGHPRTIRR